METIAQDLWKIVSRNGQGRLVVVRLAATTARLCALFVHLERRKRDARSALVSPAIRLTVNRRCVIRSRVGSSALRTSGDRHG